MAKLKFVNYMPFLTVRNRSTHRCYGAVLDAATTDKVLLFTSDDTTIDDLSIIFASLRDAVIKALELKQWV